MATPKRSRLWTRLLINVFTCHGIVWNLQPLKITTSRSRSEWLNVKKVREGTKPCQKFWLFPSMHCSRDVENWGRPRIHWWLYRGPGIVREQKHALLSYKKRTECYCECWLLVKLSKNWGITVRCKRHPKPEMITSSHIEGIQDHSPRSSKPTFRETTYVKEKVIQEGGWMEPLPGVFEMFQYFETILP